MRLLLFIHSLSSGGAERVTANLANYWAAKGWEITIVTSMPVELDFYELNPTVRRVALGGAGENSSLFPGLLQNLRRVRLLRRLLRDVRPEIALALMTTANVVLALAAVGVTGMCAIGSERIHPPQLRLGAQWEVLRRLAYGRLAAVVAQTQMTAEWLTAHTNAQRVSIIPNMATWPIPVQAPRLPPDASRAADRRMLLAVGRLDSQKGFDKLINVFSELARAHENWNLVILGEGPERPALESQVLAAKLTACVLLPGRAGNVAEWYESADLFVLSSRFEGFPNALAEALAYGLPAVSFDCDTGPREIIRQGVDGLLVPPGDTVGLKSALNRLMGDAVLRAQFASRATEARERFSMERIARMWEALFAGLRQ
jgi:glycosyltransferase involved in cell wall biosynthesis